MAAHVREDFAAAVLDGDVPLVLVRAVEAIFRQHTNAAAQLRRADEALAALAPLMAEDDYIARRTTSSVLPCADVIW